MGDMSLPPDFQDNEIIADPLYGLVPISMFEKRLIGSPEFQRLRHIKQLGFANLVYPAAEHSRFVHSIGVCHQSKIIVDRVNANMRSDLRYAAYRLHGSLKQKADPNNLPLITSLERIIISAAALLHDLPHAPFSHEIEGARRRINDGGRTEIIPSHDDLSSNPTLFLYMFSKRSILASVLRKHNADFFKALKAFYTDQHRKDMLTRQGYGQFIDFLNSGQITSDGMVKTDSADGVIRCTNAFPDGLPILSLMIFEIHLFEKQRQWLSSGKERRDFLCEKVKDNQLDTTSPLEVCFNAEPDDGTSLKWLPIPGWFRAYRKDIIGNTICADLIDYVKRDGYHSGIVSEIDLKFLDRMFIARKILPQDKKKREVTGAESGNVFQYESIPISCEHIVFDVWDHKRGCHRHSVFTEMLAYLQARYLLCERVYTHRVVESARVMLQEIVTLLDQASKELNDQTIAINVKRLHPLLYDHDDPLQPDNDATLLRWVRHVCKKALEKQHCNAVKRAKELAEMLEERRVFRESIIIDGVHGLDDAPSEKEEFACQSLEQAFIPRDHDQAHQAALSAKLQEMEDLLSGAYDQHKPNVYMTKPENYVILGIRKWAKKYKQPLVLVARPSIRKDENSALNITPLCDCEDPENIRKQLAAMEDSYNSLWRVYFFAHPFFHLLSDRAKDSIGNYKSGFGKALQEVSDIALKYAIQRTSWSWKNSLTNLDNLLPEKPLDIRSYVFYETIEPEVEDGLVGNVLKVFSSNIRKIEGSDSLSDSDAWDPKELRRLIGENKPFLSLIRNSKNPDALKKSEKTSFEKAIEDNFPSDIREAARDQAFYAQVLNKAMNSLLAKDTSENLELFNGIQE
ncbi:hypothetical protein JXA32_15780 [Candidatus Sumerlaeota bacterium]|nr:hypothetical protein [Candidatus Sumerlaeota bacterium]